MKRESEEKPTAGKLTTKRGRVDITE